MTSREEIALQLTLASIEKITIISKSTNSVTTIENLAKDVKDFYNHIYQNIDAHDTKPIKVLK